MQDVNFQLNFNSQRSGCKSFRWTSALCNSITPWRLCVWASLTAAVPRLHVYSMLSPLTVDLTYRTSLQPLGPAVSVNWLTKRT